MLTKLTVSTKKFSLSIKRMPFSVSQFAGFKNIYLYVNIKNKCINLLTAKALAYCPLRIKFFCVVWTHIPVYNIRRDEALPTPTRTNLIYGVTRYTWLCVTGTLSSVHYCTRTTRPCLTGQAVQSERLAKQ